MPQAKKKISYHEFLHREYEILHAPLQPEMDFYETIKSGNTQKLRTLLGEPFHMKEGFGTLSSNPLQNMKYHLTITVALVARYCIFGGMSLAESYSLSDYYIRMADEATSEKEISEIHDEMCIQYTQRMQKLGRSTIQQKPIRTCINYIYEHLHTRITMDDLCRITNLSPSHLSRLFKSETGSTISNYILSKKLETAKSMLLSSDYSIAEISASLAFPSQSYFTTILKKDCGMTPLQYRNQDGRIFPN